MTNEAVIGMLVSVLAILILAVLAGVVYIWAKDVWKWLREDGNSN